MLLEEGKQKQKGVKIGWTFEDVGGKDETGCNDLDGKNKRRFPLFSTLNINFLLFSVVLSLNSSTGGPPVAESGEKHLYERQQSMS